MGDKGEYYLRLVHLEDMTPTSSHVHDKEYTLDQLLATGPSSETDRHGTNRDNARLDVDDAIVPGAIVLGRQSSAAVEDRYSRGFVSPIISREHAQITVSRRGHVYITDLRSLHGSWIAPLNQFESPMKLIPYAPTQLLHGDVLILGKTVQAEEKSHAPIKLSVQFRYAKAGEPTREGRDFLPMSTPAGKAYQFATVAHVDDIYRHVAGSHISRLVYAKVDDASDGTPSTRRASYGLPPSVLYEDTDSDEEDLPRGYSWDTREPTTEASGGATRQSPPSPYYSPASPMPSSPVALRIASPRPDYYVPSEQEYDGIATPVILSPRYEGSPAYARTPSLSPPPSPAMSPPAPSLSSGTAAVMSQIIDRARHRILNSSSIYSDHMGGVTTAKETTPEHQVPAGDVFVRENSIDPMEAGYGEPDYAWCSGKSITQTKISVHSLDPNSLRSNSPDDGVAIAGALPDHDDTVSHSLHEDEECQAQEDEAAKNKSDADERVVRADSEDVSEKYDSSDHDDMSVQDDMSDQSEIHDRCEEAGCEYTSDDAEGESADEEDKENRYENIEQDGEDDDHYDEDECEDDEDECEDDEYESDDGEEDYASSTADVFEDDEQGSHEEEDELDDDEASAPVVSIEDGLAKFRTVIGKMADQDASSRDQQQFAEASALITKEVKNQPQVSADSLLLSEECPAAARRRAILSSLDEKRNNSVSLMGDDSSEAGDDDDDHSSDASSGPDDSDLDQNPYDDVSMDSDEDEGGDEPAVKEADPADWKPAAGAIVTASDLLSRQDALARLRAARAGKRVRASTPEPVAPKTDVKLEIKSDDTPRHRASTYEEGLSILRAAYVGSSPKSMSTLAEVDGPSAASATQGYPFMRERAALTSSSLEEASASFAKFATARALLDSPSERSDATSLGPVTPPTIAKTLKRVRPIEDEFDDDIIVVTPSKKPKSVQPSADTKGSIAKTVGWVVLGAALGSAGTIAGLMRIGAESAM